MNPRLLVAHGRGRTPPKAVSRTGPRVPQGTGSQTPGLTWRNRWLLALYDATGAEPKWIVKAVMGDINETLKKAWALYLGDGSCTPMTPGLWRELHTWRGLLGLPDEVAFGERHPLIQTSLRDPSPLAVKEAEKVIRLWRSKSE